MAIFLTTNGTSYEIENVIRTSNDVILIACPYFKISEVIFNRLLVADKKGVKISIVYGKNDLRKDIKEKLQKFENINLYYATNLHAKCYANEYSVILSSMNLYDFSEKNNWEMSVLFNKEDDSLIYHQILDEMNAIIETSEIKLGKRSQRIFPANPFEELKDYLNEKFDTDSFKLLKLDYEYSVVYVIENRELIDNVIITVNHRIAFELHLEEKIKKRIKEKLEVYDDKFYEENMHVDRVYYNFPDTIMVYKSLNLKKIWERYSFEEKYEYFYNKIKDYKARIEKNE
jgi:hypothetical protein